MSSGLPSQKIFSDTKNHYEILDGLRGVAALTVVVFHILEIFSGGDHTKLMINHGYLAVDFFFLLSGFVIGHAYDDRWNTMSLTQFFKRRLIRLHPMILMGMTIGAIAFYYSASPTLFPKVGEVPFSTLLLVMLIGFTLLPVPKSLEIRGWGEMHPLNGPAWSLFYEYIANILYALVVRRFSVKVLSVFVFLAGCALIQLAVTHGDVIGGWSIDLPEIRVGLTRLIYPFFAGLLISRIFKRRNINNAFLWCSILLLASLAFPRVGGTEQLWANGLYDSLAILFLFPFIVYLGACGEVKGKLPTAICRFLGDISYPLYIIHYPLMYIFYAWVVNNNKSLGQSLWMGALSFVASVLIAYGSLKFYDIPFRKWLTKKLM